MKDDWSPSSEVAWVYKQMTTSSMAQMGDQQQSTIDKINLNLLGQNHRKKKTANLEEMFVLIFYYDLINVCLLFSR